MNDTSDTYQVPASVQLYESKVKGSRFIARAEHIASVAGAENAYNAIKKKHYDATHNCYAWLINPDLFRFSDDGEPGGTAGRPILQAIEGAGILETLVVVTRYYGGTKLGTGGLIRAYGDAAAGALQTLHLKTKIRVEPIILNFDYATEKTVRHLLETYGGTISDSDYAAGVRMDVLVPRSKARAFKKQLREMTHSAVEIG